MYVHKCRQVNLLPLSKRFELNDLILFYKIVNNLLPLSLPNYLCFFDGNTRLRSCHYDSLSVISSIQPKTSSISDTNKNSALNKSFFYRVHNMWNLLPFEIRNIEHLSTFKNEMINLLWKSIILVDDSIPNEDDLFDNG